MGINFEYIISLCPKSLQFCQTILLVYMIKMVFFFIKIRIFCKSIAGNISQHCSSVYTTTTILLVYIPAKIKMRFIWKDDFFLPKSASSVSRSQAHLAKRKCIGWSIGFNYWTNWTLYGVIPRSLCQIRLNDVFEMLNCWERLWIGVDSISQTLSALAAIFSGVRTVFGLSRFGLWMRMPVSSTLFTK